MTANSPELSDASTHSFSIDPTQFSITGDHTKKSRYYGPYLKQIERSDDSILEENIEYNWNNPSDYEDNSFTIKHNECPNGASKNKYEVIAICNDRYNPNVAGHQYHLISQDPNNPKKHLAWWTEFIDECPDLVIEHYEQKFLRAVREEHEFRTAIKQFKKTKKYHFKKWYKKKRRSKYC